MTGIIRKNTPVKLICTILTNPALMSALFILVAVSLVMAISFLVAFLWAQRVGQYDDDYTPSVRILFDDENYEKPGTE